DDHGSGRWGESRPGTHAAASCPVLRMTAPVGQLGGACIFLGHAGQPGIDAQHLFSDPALAGASPAVASAFTFTFSGTAAVFEGFLLVGRLDVDEQVVNTPAHHDVLPQRYRAGLVDDDGGVTAYLLQPFAELLRIADRGRKGDHTHRLGQVDD